MFSGLAGNVANMSATCWPDSQMLALLANTALSSQHKTDPDSIFVSGMADIYPFLLLVPEVRMHNPPKTSTYVVVLVYHTIGAQSKVFLF
jgi:hypothetical protein